MNCEIDSKPTVRPSKKKPAIFDITPKLSSKSPAEWKVQGGAFARTKSLAYGGF